MFPKEWEYHIGPVISDLVDWLLVEFGGAFDAVSGALLRFLLQVEAALKALPWWLIIAAVGVGAWLLLRRVGSALALMALVFMIGVFGLWGLAVETMAIIITSVVLAIVIGLPVGVAMAESNRVRGAMTPLLDAMQTLPSFVYLIPAMMLFGLGKVPAVLATLIYAVPPVIRLTDLGIRQVAAGVQEAAVAYGASRWQLLKEVRLPLAVPSILAGVNQTTMMALAMVVIASMIGARGIGQEVLLSINRIDVGRGFEAGLSVVALAIVVDRLTQGFARRFEPPR
ncbi:MAG: ABC transporter permease subunit [Firmicutes bacterium]|nr:ABC transporter permease subunit [Bacillota bacterium]